ncbi:AraC family transcriptional regulator [Saccharicrinis aurantiacus]|uniref:AraC family transcriptional regulator n=1 Tax=Saccharicrinis aurantiacus TaxID=1849719 RepID=UPI0009500655|nr:AraC family transcriptional regulator [Saccharicrinis aurantiacus]
MKQNSKSTSKNKLLEIERLSALQKLNQWHSHDEYELVYYVKGEGDCVIGDNLAKFKTGDLILVGESLPHLWKDNELSRYNELDIVTVKFDTSHSGLSLLSAKEFLGIKDLLSISRHGILFSNETSDRLHDLFISITQADETLQIILLLQILNTLTKCNKKSLLAADRFAIQKSRSDVDRLNKVIEFVNANYTKPLSLDNISESVAMSPNSLCRFFKTRTNRTIIQYINDFRVGKACEMLITGDLSISEICFEVGFNSLTSFNRVFKEIKKETPRSYKRKYQVLNTRYRVEAYSA